MLKPLLMAPLCALLLASCALPAAKNGRAHERGDFHAVVEKITQRAIGGDPELRSMLGLTGGEVGDLSDQLTDVSLPRRQELRDQLRGYLAEVQAWDRDVLSGQERWTHDLVSWYFETQIDLMSFDWSPAWLPTAAGIYAVDQLFSIPVQLPQFMENHHAVADVGDVENYIERLRAIETKLDQVRANFDMQAEQGVIPPRVALAGAASQIRAILASEPTESAFVRTLERRSAALADLPESRRQALRRAAIEVVARHVNPAYARLLARIDEEIARTPGDHGVWALPDGAAFYAAALRWNTSTDLDADTIHRIGLEEVGRIEREMDALLDARALRGRTLGERVARLAKDPRHGYPDTEAGRDELLADVRGMLDRLQPHLAEVFGRMPEQPLQVRRVSAQAEATSPSGYYYAPALDGSRPGTFFINLGDMASHTRWNLPTLVYHEASPGHHFQIALGQTLEDLPLIRRSLNPSAFTEGWALYAEQLAAELGVYATNPLGELGRLQSEMFRAVRLVVDTGLHHKRWSPKRAEAYLHEKTGIPLEQARMEINRYLVQPGQACSYKVGHLKMVELRERAKTRLGENFDLRAFHDVVLGNGALPLRVLEQVVEEWIATQERAGPARVEPPAPRTG